jgi:hypothetical protein
MKVIDIQEKENTPSVKLDAGEGVFKIEGKSHPENALKFYAPILEWFDEYKNSPNEVTEMNFNFMYFNTASSKMILGILERLAEIFRTGKKVSINWYHLEEDEDMMDEGTYFSNITGLPFNFIEIEN